jgi:hypothetical protein
LDVLMSPLLLWLAVTLRTLERVADGRAGGTAGSGRGASGGG